MAGPLRRLSKEKFYDKPHLISPTSLEVISEFLEDRNSGNKEMAVNPKDMPTTIMEKHIEDGVAYLPVSGALTYESTGWEAMCGGQSYQRLQAMFDESVSMGVKTIVLDIDSPGGEAYGMFELGSYMRDKADKNGVKLISYVDGLAASAGYGLAASAHEIVSNPQAEVGSVGVVVKLRNSESEKTSTYVYAGENKIPYDAEGNFSEGFLQDLQDKVDTLYEGFTSYVAEMRDMKQQDVIDTQAKVFMAKDAVENGLVDALLTREEFFEKLAQKEGGESMPLLNSENGEDKQMSVKNAPENEALVEMQAKIESMQAALDQVNQEKQELADQAKKAELASLEGVAQAWEMFGVDSKAYAEAAIEGSVPVGMFNASMDKASEQLKEQKELNSSLKDEIEALGEVGVASAESEEIVEEDGVEAALSKFAKLK